MNKSETFIFDKIPSNISELLELPEAKLKNPFQAAALTVVAICAY